VMDAERKGRSAGGSDSYATTKQTAEKYAEQVLQPATEPFKVWLALFMDAWPTKSIFYKAEQPRQSLQSFKKTGISPKESFGAESQHGT